MKKQFKAVQILLAVAVFCLCVGKTDAFAATRLATAEDIEYAPADIVVSVDVESAVEAGVSVSDYVSETKEHTFTLTKESYVCFRVGIIERVSTTASADFQLSIGQNGSVIKAFDGDTPYGADDTYQAIVLKPGTYTAKLYATGKYSSSDRFKYTCKVGYIPVDEIIEVTPTFKNGKLTVGVTTNLLSHEKAVRYRKGAVEYKYKDSVRYWDTYGSKGGVLPEYIDQKASDKKCIVITDEKIKVSKPGKYTINVIDENNVTVSQIFDFTKFDKKKPVVKGVKNKKTYKKTVKITFYDKQSGIKSAKLNNKKIKSGYKVKKNGSYKLVVTDNFGNKTTIKFKVKK